ncbi:unnamed protein product, partial [Prorocentrum cordatum]
ALEAVRIQLNGQAPSLDQQAQSAIQPSLDETGESFPKQFDVHAARVDEHDERMDKHDEKLQVLQGELAEFKKLLAVAEERPVVPIAVPSGFSRDPDHTLAVVMSQVPTTLAAVKESLDEWLLSLAFKPEDYKIEAAGPLPSRRFLIKLGGPVAPATRKVQMVLSKLRDPKQVKQEITLRKCKDALQELRGAGSRILLDRERGVLSIGWDKALRVEVFNGESPPKLRWVVEGLQKHRISKAQAVAATQASLEKNYLARRRPHHTIASLQEVHQDELQLRAFINQTYPVSALMTGFVGAE